MKHLRFIVAVLIACFSSVAAANELHDYFAPPDAVKVMADHVSDFPNTSPYDLAFVAGIQGLSVEMLRLFLDNHPGVDLNEPLPGGRSLIENLIWVNRTDLLEVLRLRGLRVDPDSAEGERALLEAARSGSDQPLRYLIGQGFNPNHIMARQDFFDSPLMASVRDNALEPFRYLLSLNQLNPLLNVRNRTPLDLTALHMAVIYGRVVMAQEILANLRAHNRLHELDRTGILAYATVIATAIHTLPEQIQVQMTDANIAANARLILRDLIDAGADPHSIVDDTSAWRVAEGQNNEEVLAIFRSRQPTNADRLRTALFAVILVLIQQQGVQTSQ